MSLATTTEPIEMPFRLWSWVGPRKHVVDGGAHCRHLVNTIQPSTYVGSVALCQISFNTLRYRLSTVLFVRKWAAVHEDDCVAVFVYVN